MVSTLRKNTLDYSGNKIKPVKELWEYSPKDKPDTQQFFFNPRLVF